MNRPSIVMILLGTMVLTMAADVLSAGEPSGAATSATTSPSAGVLLSRTDLPRLKKLDRSGVFAALGSFDDRGLPED